MKLSKHEEEALNWIFRAQEISKDGGISKYYKIGKGWAKESYKEVSGYIIPTLLEAFKKTKNSEYKKRAARIANWEVNVQDKDGKWEYVFDTGQVLIGLTRIYQETNNETYKQAIIKGADWLARVQGSDGNWSEGEFALGIRNKIFKKIGFFSNLHNTRTAWALLEAWKITKNEKYKSCAIKNLNWAIAHQLKNGYYLHCHTYSHYLVYTASGLLESGIILNEKRYIHSARLFADNCISLLKRSRYFEGNYNNRWRRVGKSHSCLTADAQLAILLYRLYKITKEEKYKSCAKNLINFVKKNQNLTSKNPGIKGGIAGSYPLNGAYCPHTLLSWATKFYLDALFIDSSKDKEIKS